MDANSSLDECVENEKDLTIIALYMTIATVGIIGNSVVVLFIVVFKEYRKTIINIYIIQLAIADLIFCIQIFSHAGSMLQGQWTYGRHWCKISEAVKMLSYYASIAFLTVMSVDRYMAINLSMSQQIRKCRSKIAVFVVSLCAWCIPLLSIVNIAIYADVRSCQCEIFFPLDPVLDTYSGSGDDYSYDSYYGSDYGSTWTKEYSINGDVNTSKNILDIAGLIEQQACSLNGDRISQYFKTWLVCNFLLAFVVPLIIICVAYALIVRRIMKQTAASADCKTSSNTRTRVTKMVTGLVTIFIVCWFPYHSLNLARLNGLKLKSGPCNTAVNCTLVLAYCNSAINPFFYMSMSRKFRHSLADVIRRGQCGRQQHKGTVGKILPTTANRETRISSLSGKSRDNISLNSYGPKTRAVLSDNRIHEDKL